MNEAESPYILPEPTTAQVETGSRVASVASGEDLQDVTSDIAHVNLFGSFLICGTLVGIFLFRRLAK